MADQNIIIAASVKVDTGSANPNVKELNKSLKDVKVSLKDAGKEASVTSKEIGDASGSFKNIKEQIGSLPGPLGSATSGVSSLNTMFKALLANPVGAVLLLIVGAVTLLYKAFTNTYEGGQKMEQIFAAIGAAGQALLDNVDKIIGSFVKLISLDFSGFIKDSREIGEAVAGAAASMANLTAEAQKLAREQATNDLDAAKRARDLAILREQANDESVPLAKRKAALKQLKEAAEQNSKEDIDLARRTAENKIAQLTVEKDGAKKNFIEIQKIKADQIKGETENANELRRIGKQLTAAEKQEIAERKLAQKAAEEARKQERQKQQEFNNKLLKIQQENELLSIKDAYAKEQKALENKIDAEKRANLLAFEDKKISREQFNLIEEELLTQAHLQRIALTEKHNAEVLKQEEEHKKKQEAIKKEEDAKAKEEEKNRIEKEKEELGLAEQKQKAVIDATNADFDAKRAAADALQEIYQKEFDDKVITELEYNNKVAGLADARKKIREEEQAHNQSVVSAIGTTLGNLSELAGKQTVLGKAFAVAQTAINTYQSAIAAYKSLAGIPVVGPALGAIAAAAAIKTGIDAVKRIVAVQVPGHGGGGGSAPSGLTAPAAPVAPTQSSTKLDASTISGIGDATKGGVKAYVVESESGTQREKDERLARAARLGGG